MTEVYDVVIVGGGIAGLTAAAYLSRAGKKTLLLEKNDQCGGLVNSFTREGFLFDGGVRALESAGIILPMLRELNIQLDLIPNPVSIGIEDRIIHVNSSKSVVEYEELLTQVFPESREEIKKAIALINKITADMEILYGLDNPLFNDFLNDKAYFTKTFLPWLIKFLFTLQRIKKMRMPVEDLLKSVITNPSLADMIDQHFFENTPAFFALSYFYLYQDYFYPRGGVGKLAEAVMAKIAGYGGTIQTGTRVTEIQPQKQILMDEGGNIYEYRHLLWAADIKTLYRITKTDGLPAKTAQKISTFRAEIEPKHGADSVFLVYLAVNETPEFFRQRSHGHFFYTPDKRGLGEINRSERKRMLRNWPAVTRANLSEWIERFCRFNTYEIAIPVLKDPAAAPQGKTGLIISTLFDYRLVKKVQESGWYESFREEVADRMAATLNDSIYPGLKEKILFKFSATPLSIEKTVGSSEGAIIGWSYSEPIPVVSEMLAVSKSVFTVIPGVYQAGQWAYSPAGVPTSIMTGKLAADTILKQKPD